MKKEQNKESLKTLMEKTQQKVITFSLVFFSFSVPFVPREPIISDRAIYKLKA